jgi:hypothetical protein
MPVQRQRQAEEDGGPLAAAAPASLEAARALEARQEEALRLLQREVAELERQRDQLKRDNSELGLTGGSPTKRTRGRPSADANLQQIMCVRMHGPTLSCRRRLTWSWLVRGLYLVTCC